MANGSWDARGANVARVASGERVRKPLSNGGGLATEILRCARRKPSAESQMPRAGASPKLHSLLQSKNPKILIQLVCIRQNLLSNLHNSFAECSIGYI